MIAPPENPRPAYDEMATPPAEVALSPVLWQVLFDPASWRESLDAYAHTTHLAVALVDVAGSLLGPCLNPQPTWSLLHTTQAADSGCPFSMSPDQPCTCVEEALATRQLIWKRERMGLVHGTVPLRLANHTVGALLAGQVFDQYPDHLMLERMATRLGLSPERVWAQARLELPVKRATLQVYGRLLATLGQTFLYTRYHTLRDAGQRAALEAANRELRRTQVALATTRDRYSDLYDRAPMAYLTLDAAGRICEANLLTSTLLGVVREQLLGQPLAHWVDAGDQDTLERHRQSVVDNGLPQHCELVMRRANGSRFSTRLESSAEQDEAGHPTYCRMMLSDITAHKQIETQRLQAQKMAALGTLAGGMAHNFNNILSAVLGYATLAQDDIPKTSPAWNHIQNIIVAGERAADLVRQVLTFSRPSPSERQPLQLSTLVQETVRMLRASVPSSVAIRTHFEANADTVFADPAQLQQVILNLGNNAAHAMRTTGGALDIQLDNVDALPGDVAPPPELQPGPYLRLTLQDTGVGMAPEVMARIFEPFFTTKDVGEGTGLGLALVHGIVTSHGGTLTLSSVLGQGTTCTVYLPRTRDAADAAVDVVHRQNSR